MAESKPTTQTELSDLWDRVGYVEISIGDQKPMVFKGLDFKFQVRKVLASMVEGMMKVEIHGLTQDHINEIVTVCDQTEAIAQRKRVKVYAGYRDPGNPQYEGDLIACMDILYASVTSPPPDLWLTIEGVQNNYYSQIAFKYKSEAGFRKEVTTLKIGGVLTDKVTSLSPDTHKINKRDDAQKYRILNTSKISATTAIVEVEYWYQRYMTLEHIIDDLVKCINNAFIKAGQKNRVRYEIYLPENQRKKQVPSFVFEGPMANLPTKIGLTFNVFCFFEYSYGEEDVLVIMEKDNLQSPTTEEAALKRMNRGKRQVRTKKLDVEHGLIGIPTIANTTSLKCRCLLDPKLSVGDYIDIDSVVMPVVKSDAPGWQINKISFTGHLRGNAWYTDITAIDWKRMREYKPTPVKTYVLN